MPSNFWPSTSALAVRFEQRVERDDRLAVRRALADDAGPGGVVEFGVVVGVIGHVAPPWELVGP